MQRPISFVIAALETTALFESYGGLGAEQSSLSRVATAKRAAAFRDGYQDDQTDSGIGCGWYDEDGDQWYTDKTKQVPINAAKGCLQCRHNA